MTISGAFSKLCADPVDDGGVELWFLGPGKKDLFEPVHEKVLVISLL